jgi:hypothetical protein
MTLFSCAAVQRRLAAFHDRELPVEELITIEGHVKDCPPCASELRQLATIGNALRIASAPGPADDWTGLTPSVISRMRAEEQESVSARAQRLFEDMHLVWIGLASTAATFLCAAVALGTLHFASPERNDSLAAFIAVVSAPSGSDLNPVRLDARMQAPRLPDDGVVMASVARTISDEDRFYTLSAVVSREGRVSDVSVLSNDHDQVELTDLIGALSQSRLQPAELAGSPVAVNLVWLLAQTTVKAKLRS